MTISINTYTDPGVYQQEVIVPGNVSVVGERVACYVGIAPRTRRTTDEQVIRGKVYDETLTVASASPHTATMVNASNRDRTNAILFLNGNALGLNDWSFLAAKLTGGAGTPVNTGVNKYITISLDGKRPLVILLTSGVATPLTTIVTDINTQLVASPIYGAAYSAVASTVATVAPNDTLVLTSPLATAASDLKVYLSPTLDAASAVSNAAWAPSIATGVQADTRVQVSDLVYVSGATYTIEYVSIETVTDPLENAASGTPLSALLGVGSYPSTANYVQDIDYEDNTNTVDWVTTSVDQATVTSSVAGPYAIVLATSDVMTFSLNGKTPIAVTITAGAIAASVMALALNTALAASSVYGPAYAHTVSDAGGKLKFDVPKPFANSPEETGASSSIVFYTNATNAFPIVFGAGITLPYEIHGTGNRPAFGTSYYVTYDYTRATTDYDLPVRVYNLTQMYDFTSPITVGNYTRNKLGIAGELAFENGASSIWLQLINDSSSPGTPVTGEIHDAIDNCAEKSGITEMVVLDTTSDTHVYLMQHVADQSSMLQKHYRRGWFGMARGTDVGDPDTPDTFIYAATRTLQPGGTSPARGRLILAAPADGTRSQKLEDGRFIDVDLDGSFIAAGIAGLYTSLASPSDTLINKMLKGFSVTDFGTYLKGERHVLAGNGVCVVTEDAGKLVLLDPLTTEAGGGKVVQFEEPASSAQKDAVSATVDSLLYNNCVGVVPDDLADFIGDVKKWIMLGILANIGNGTIGPYKDSSGITRDIDPKSDIQVFQSPTDPRTYLFQYWYNLRYPAKRFFGEYSVDNPFFSPSA